MSWLRWERRARRRDGKPVTEPMQPIPGNIAVVVLALALTGAAVPAPADRAALPADATLYETAAHAVFSTHCARCHQVGRLKDGLNKPYSGLGHILELRRLAEDKKFVTPGDPAGSKVLNVIGESGYPSMPYDNQTGFPAAQEIAHVATWIRSLGRTAAARPFISLADEHRLALADAHRQPPRRWDRIRYLSLRVPHNDAGVSDANLRGYRTAALKLLNALSWNPNPFRHRAADDHRILIRIFLPDLNWTADTWRLLERQYPHGAAGGADESLRLLRMMTGAEAPVMRADWFASVASVSPLYYELLGLPDAMGALEEYLGIDLRANIRNEQVIRAGFQDSGVSTNNRLVERHAMGSGFFWTSYDFAGSAGRRNLFEYPLGPAGALSTERAFRHDGGESIFTLPNGFHAYYLSAADGARLDVGPAEIVRDDDYTDGTGEVVNAISCMSCHSRGMRINTDTVRPVALNNLRFSADERQMIAALYPGQDQVDTVLKQDTASFRSAMERAGLDPDAEAGGREPIRGLFVYYVDDFIDFARAGNELGLTEDQLRSRLSFVGTDLAGLMVRLDQSPIARDEWNAVFRTLLGRVTDYRPIGDGCADGAPGTSLPYSVRQVAGCAQDLPETGETGSATIVSPAETGSSARKLTMFTDEPSYAVGDAVRIFVEPRVPCRLTLINVDAEGDRCVLFPHPALPDELLPGGERFVYPPEGARITATEAGTETILAFCNASREAIGQPRRDTSDVSCDAAQRPDTSAGQAAQRIYRTIVIDPNAAERTTESGVTYQSLSSHNPDLLQAQMRFEVTH